MKGPLASLYWLTLFIVGFVLISFTWLVTTTQGSRWLIHQAASWSEQSISISGIEGSLASKLRVKALSYSAGEDALKVSLEDLRLEWNARVLWDKTLHVKTLSARRVRLELVASKNERPLSPPVFSLPLDVQLDALEINQLIIDNGKTPIELEALKLGAKMHDSFLTIDHLSLQQADQGVKAHGTISFAAPFDIDTAVQLFDNTSNAKTAFTIKGEMEHYALSGSASLHRQDTPSVDAVFSGTGSLSEIRLETFDLQTLNGQIQGSAEVQWKDSLRVHSSFRGERLDPSVLSQGMQGELGLDGSIEFENTEFKTQLSVIGQLRDYPLDLKIKADGSALRVHLEEGKLHSGPNLLELSGYLTRDAIEDLNWQLAAPDLNTLHAELKGHLDGQGQLSGHWKQLTGSGSLVGGALRYQDTRLESFELMLEPLENEVQKFQVDLNVANLSIAQKVIQQIELVASGSLDEQQTDYRIVETGNTLSGHVSSQKYPQQWQIQLSDTRLESKLWPVLKQQEISTITFADGQAELTEFCFRGEPESFCLLGQSGLNKTQAQLDVKAVPVKRFEQWVSATGELKDKLNGTVQINQLDNKQWSIQSTVVLDRQNKLDSSITIDNETKAIEGGIKVNANKLEWLALFNDQLFQVEGEINADIKLNGSLDKPEAQGKIQLIEAEAKLPVAGIQLEQMNLTLQTVDSAHAKIIGSVHSNEGEIRIGGTAAWQPLDEWRVNLELMGEDFQLVNLAELQLLGSPNLNIAIQADKVAIKGEVKIPTAHLWLENLPDSAIRVSKDVHIVGEQAEQTSKTKTQDKEKTIPVYADVKLLLGDNISLEGDGMDVNMGGELTLQAKPDKPLQANGEIDIIEGSYSAYGQDLELKDSSFVFNGPISQPGLDLKAQRKIEDITVGLLIKGTLQSPQSTIFSVPLMSETDAIAYLLTGKPLNSAGAEEGSLIASALTSLSVKGSAGLIEKIRNATGLSTLEIESGSDSTQTALLIGKYLSPKVYVQYVKRLFLEGDSFQVQYHINDRLKLEGESGPSQGVDLIYQFEQ